MNKGLLAVPAAVALAGASWAGATLYSGAETREAYERLVAGLDEALGLGIEIETVSYAAGFLVSEAITELRRSDAPEATVIARLRHRIEHSPVGVGDTAGLRAARVVTTLLIDEAADSDLTDLLAGFGGVTPLTLDSEVGFDGDSTHRLSLAPYAYAAADGSSVTVDAASWDIDVGVDGSFSGTGRWEGAVLALGGGATLAVAGTSDRFDYRRLGAALYDGEYHLEIPEILMNPPLADASVALRELAVTSSTRVASERLSSTIRLAVGDIDAPIALDSAAFELRVDGLAVDALERLYRSATRLQALSPSADEGVVRDALGGYLAALGATIVPGSALRHELVLGNAGGEARATLEIGFDGDGSPGGKDHLVGPEATLGELVRATSASLSVRADAEALALTPAAMFLDPSALAPWVVVDGEGDYRADIGVDDLIVDVNGMPMSLELLAGDALAMPLDLDDLLEMQR